MLWPMMPNESLAKLANNFYPNSPILAQRFIQKSIRLSRTIGVHIVPDVPFQQAQVIAIPDEKEVRAITHRIKKREELLTEQAQLRLSYQLKMALPDTPNNIDNLKPANKTSAHQKAVGLVLPELNVPNIAVPPLQTPKVEHMTKGVISAGHDVWTQIQSTWQISMAWLGDWQGYALDKSDQMRQMHPANIWANQSVQTGFLLGGMGLVVWIVWRVQKRYMQEKIALLNSIEGTLIEPELIEPTIGEIAMSSSNDDRAEHTPVFGSALETSSDVHDSVSKAASFQDTKS